MGYTVAAGTLSSRGDASRADFLDLGRNRSGAGRGLENSAPVFLPTAGLRGRSTWSPAGARPAWGRGVLGGGQGGGGWGGGPGWGGRPGMNGLCVPHGSREESLGPRHVAQGPWPVWAWGGHTRCNFRPWPCPGPVGSDAAAGARSAGWAGHPRAPLIAASLRFGHRVRMLRVSFAEVPAPSYRHQCHGHQAVGPPGAAHVPGTDPAGPGTQERKSFRDRCAGALKVTGARVSHDTQRAARGSRVRPGCSRHSRSSGHPRAHQAAHDAAHLQGLLQTCRFASGACDVTPQLAGDTGGKGAVCRPQDAAWEPPPGVAIPGEWVCQAADTAGGLRARDWGGPGTQFPGTAPSLEQLYLGSGWGGQEDGDGWGTLRPGACSVPPSTLRAGARSAPPSTLWPGACSCYPPHPVARCTLLSPQHPAAACTLLPPLPPPRMGRVKGGTQQNGQKVNKK
ncbi:unnamed protein product [Nyctereutes procyonoides]|uniref:(raccoon dog) hypothetical protein n=1 Tax=Nyctereutes procyonoides TaxID=34880 RepID=A0A811YH36_NYCPR|nr:unnamed protein product [Nyctereutes procyonoides]